MNKGKRVRAETEVGEKSTLDKPVASHGTQYETSLEFLKLLITMKVESLTPSDNKIFVCQRTDKIADVWKGLIKHNFLSVPVLQKTGKKYYGFVDLADIVAFFVEHFGDKKLGETEDFWAMVDAEQQFQKLTVNDVMKYPLNKRNQFHPVPRGFSLWTAVELLAREEGLHRVPVIDSNWKLVNMITQSQLIRHLNEHIDDIADKKNKPLHLISSLQKPVISIHENEITMNAFKKMNELGLPAIAVVNNEGHLVGNISIRDLKGISGDARLFWRLYQTVKNFLHKIREEYQQQHGRPRTVVTVTPEESLENAIKKLAEHNIHRVYMVNSEKKPVGVCSLKDILLEIVS